MLTPAALLAACAVPASVPPQDTSAPTPVAESRVTSAALFKNGLAFVERRVAVAKGAREVVLDTLPVPVHGTFWIAADPAVLVVGAAVARPTRVLEPVPATSLLEILRANVGRELSLVLSDGSTISGELLGVPEPLAPEGPMPLGSYRPAPPSSNLVLLGTQGGSVALAPSDVRRVGSSDGPLSLEVERAREASSLTIELEPRDSGPAELSIQYLERGLTWAPSYAIDISDPERALLSAKAEVIDEVEDLEGATLQFVTGFPNLQFSHVIDPIALRGDLEAFLRALGQDPVQSGGAVAQQAVMSNFARNAGDDARFPVAGAPQDGSAVEDLFFYEQRGVTLKRGERGLYPLFTVSVPYEHLYEWEIADTIEGRGSQSEEEQVWHSVRLSNETGLPWTTAPAMTMKDGRLLGQDTLSYAAVGARTTVRITRAVDVQGEQNEFEVGRDRNAASFYGRAYDRVTVRGELRATNHKRESVRLEITKQIQGEVTKNPEEASVVAVAHGLRQVNPNTRLTWSLPLEAGASADVTYEYTLYVRP